MGGEEERYSGWHKRERGQVVCLEDRCMYLGSRALLLNAELLVTMKAARTACPR